MTSTVNMHPKIRLELPVSCHSALKGIPKARGRYTPSLVYAARVEDDQLWFANNPDRCFRYIDVPVGWVRTLLTEGRQAPIKELTEAQQCSQAVLVYQLRVYGHTWIEYAPIVEDDAVEYMRRVLGGDDRFGLWLLRRKNVAPTYDDERIVFPHGLIDGAEQAFFNEL